MDGKLVASARIELYTIEFLERQHPQSTCSVVHKHIVIQT